MKHNIGSKQAELLARKKFGDRAAVQRRGKEFFVGTVIRLLGNPLLMVKGEGKSWETALIDAGVPIPDDVTPEVVEKPRPAILFGAPMQRPDTMPEDTDAKEPDLGDGV